MEGSRVAWTLAAVAAGLAVSCAGSTGADVVTYSARMASVMDSRCVPCHSAALTGARRHGAPDACDYDTYAGALACGVKGNTKVQAGQMPLEVVSTVPSPLPSDEKALWQEWIDEGMQE